MLQKYKVQNRDGRVLALKDGTPHVVEAHTRGEAKAAFRKAHGEKPSKPGGKKMKTSRRRLPVGYRVRLLGYPVPVK